GLGVMWYQVVAGDRTKEPPRGGSWKRKFIDRGATEEMVALLERCMEDEPDDRPADAQALVEALAPVIRKAADAATFAPVTLAPAPAPPSEPPLVLQAGPRPPPSPPPPPRAAFRVVFPGAWSGIGDEKFKFYLDGVLLGEGSAFKGVDLRSDAEPGNHVLEIATVINEKKGGFFSAA